jgi:hypothetical protein
MVDQAVLLLMMRKGARKMEVMRMMRRRRKMAQRFLKSTLTRQSPKFRIRTTRILIHTLALKMAGLRYG